MPRRFVLMFTTGLLAAPLLALPAPGAFAAPVHVSGASVVAKKDYCHVTGSSAVRAKPRNGAAVLGTAHKGDTCTAHGWAGDGSWVKITIKRTGKTGYVRGSRVAWGKEESSHPG